MILTVYVLKNRLSGIFERPFAEPYSIKEYPDLLAQSLAMADIDSLNRHKEFDVFCVGSFDNKSGELKTLGSPEFILSLEQLCEGYILAKSKKVEANV